MDHNKTPEFTGPSVAAQSLVLDEMLEPGFCPRVVDGLYGWVFLIRYGTKYVGII